MASSPTSRSLAALRKDGWTAEVVEKWIPGANVRKDLFGFVDIVAIRRTRTVGVQATSASNVSSRVDKIQTSPLYPLVLAAGWEIEVHGWKKRAGRWVPVIICMLLSTHPPLEIIEESAVF